MFEKHRDALLFFLSTLFLAFLFGFAVRERGWFPTEHLLRAAHEASRMKSPPTHVVSRVYSRSGVTTSLGEDVGEGLTLISSFWSDSSAWKPGLNLVDVRGRVLHTWRVDAEEVFEDELSNKPVSYGRVWDFLGVQERSIHGAHLLPNGDVLANVFYMGTVRLDACGNSVWAIDELSHHSVEPVEDGTFWLSDTAA